MNTINRAMQYTHINLDLGLREMAADIRKKYNVNELRD